MKKFLFLLFFIFLNYSYADPLVWKELAGGKSSGNSRLINLPESVLDGKQLRMNHWDACWQKGKGPDHCLKITDEIS